MESKEWERFKTETTKQLSTFVKFSKYGETAKDIISMLSMQSQTKP